MPLRVIDRQLFVTDDGRTVYASGGTLFLIPDTDLPLFVRVRSRYKGAAVGLSFAVLAVMIVMNLNVEFSFVLWAALAVAVSLACSQMLHAWMRDRFTTASDEPILREVRDLAQAARGSRWLLLLSLAAYPLLYYSKSSGPHGGWFSLIVSFIAVVLASLQWVAAKNQRDVFESGERSSVTR